jgi:hypothetical protein
MQTPSRSALRAALRADCSRTTRRLAKLARACAPYGWSLTAQALLLEQRARALRAECAVDPAPPAPRFSPVPLFTRAPAAPGGYRDLARPATLRADSGPSPLRADSGPSLWAATR